MAMPSCASAPPTFGSKPPVWSPPVPSEKIKTGQPSELVNSMLHAFEVSLRAFQKHRELVLNQLQHRLSEYSH